MGCHVEVTKDEIEKLFPSVYITLVSILFGFAVEDVVAYSGDSDHPFRLIPIT